MKYLLKHRKITGSIIFQYDELGRIIAFQFDCEITDDIWDYITGHFPLRIETLKHPAFKNFEIMDVPEDLSFDAFWNAYQYKVGNKERARKLYNLLDDHERTRVFSGIKKYNAFLAKKTTRKGYILRRF
jgi:hypothetical protein